MRRLKHLLGDRSGAAALEFALIGLPFIMLLLGLIEVGRALHIRTALDAAADRAQRAILIDPAASAETIEAEIRKVFHAGQSDPLAITYETGSTSGIDYRLVMLDYSMELFLPAPLGGAISIGSTRRVAIP